MMDDTPADAPAGVAGARNAGADQSQRLTAVLEQASANYANRPALRFFGKPTSYRELQVRITEAALVLRRIGAGPGVRIAMLLPSSPLVPVYMYAAFAVGATVVPLDPAGRIDDLMRLVRASGVTLLVTCDLSAFASTAAALSQHGAVTDVVLLSHAAMLPVLTAAHLRLFGSDRLVRQPSGFACRVQTERDLARDAGVQAITASGATPRPAGLDDIAFLSGGAVAGQWRLTGSTQANLASNVAQVRAALPTLSPGGERIVVALPVWHPLAFGVAVTLALTHGAELTLLPDLATKPFVDAIKARQPTVIMAPAPLLGDMITDPGIGTAALAALRFGLAVGGAVLAKTHAGLAALTKAPLLECYGLLSAPSVVAITQPGDGIAPAGGQLLDATTVTVRDLADQGREVPRGERGEICVRGPQIAKAAQLDPSAGAHIGQDLATGDLGLMDPQGRLFIVDRVDDLIVAAGYLIYPRRIETALLEHPAVIDAAVIGISDGRRGQAPKAFVVVRRGEPITERDLRVFLASRISKIEMPADIDFKTNLPRTPFGLICKSTLRRENGGGA